MALSEKFIEWSSGIDFRTECHHFIVKDFDEGAEIWEYKTDPFDECGYYTTLTCVRFSDGSLHSFNYKGEW